MSLTFKQFYEIMREDTQQDIDKLMADISMIDAQIAQRVTPLNARKMQLQKQLALKQNQKQAEDKQQNNQAASQQGAGQTGMQSATQTTTPGGTRSATPGGAPSVTQ